MLIMLVMMPIRFVFNHVIVHIVLCHVVVISCAIHTFELICPQIIESLNHQTHPFRACPRYAIPVDMVLVADCVGVWRCPLDRHVGAAHDQLAYVIHTVLFSRVSLGLLISNARPSRNLLGRELVAVDPSLPMAAAPVRHRIIYSCHLEPSRTPCAPASASPNKSQRCSDHARERSKNAGLTRQWYSWVQVTP